MLTKFALFESFLANSSQGGSADTLLDIDGVPVQSLSRPRVGKDVSISPIAGRVETSFFAKVGNRVAIAPREGDEVGFFMMLFSFTQSTSSARVQISLSMSNNRPSAQT